MQITMTVNGAKRTVEAHPLRRLLDILRVDLGLTGTKEGCGEGECGACSVRLDGKLVNACLVPAFQLQGVSVDTIEGLGTAERPDPLQKVFVEQGAVQCGFCTPGMVIASRVLLDGNPNPDRSEIRTALAGNLCRCTGYEKIIGAVELAAREQNTGSTVNPTEKPDSGNDCSYGDVGGEMPASSPGSLDEAIALLAEHGPETTLVAGGTDLMTNLKLGLVSPRRLLDVTRIPEARGISSEEGSLDIGAATTFAEIAAHAQIKAQAPILADLARRVAAAAVQNRATIGGNLVTGSPAADSPPALLALDAVLVLAGPGGRREVPMADFYTGYRETARRPDEILLRIRVPVPPAETRQSFFKVGTRQAQACAKVNLAARTRLLPDGKLADVRLAAGSVAPTVISLKETAQFLEGRTPDGETIQEATRLAEADAIPIDDVRSTADYRRTITGRLVARFLQDL